MLYLSLLLYTAKCVQAAQAMCVQHRTLKIWHYIACRLRTIKGVNLLQELTVGGGLPTSRSNTLREVGTSSSTAQDESMVPTHLEVAYIPHQRGGSYGGLYLFTHAARMMRPVQQLGSFGGLELLGTLEQCNMDIYCPDGGDGGSPGIKFTHAELAAGEAVRSRGSKHMASWPVALRCASSCIG